MNKRLTQDKVEELYKSKKIKIESKYRNNKHKNRLLCLRCGNRWESTLNILKQGSGCPRCQYVKDVERLRRLAKGQRHTQQKVTLDYLAAGILNKSVYKDVHTKNKLECRRCGHNWEARYKDFASQGCGCPCCNPGGFNPSKPAYLYRLELDLGEDKYYKIGICGEKRLKRRIKEIGGGAKLISKKYYKKGKDAQKEEARLHKKLSKYRVNLEGIVRSGYTEFFTKYE